MTAKGVVSLNHELLHCAEDLVHQNGALPAGVVLRCFARAVAEARRAGCELGILPAVARRSAEQRLLGLTLAGS